MTRCEEENKSWRDWNKVDGVKWKAGSAETRFPQYQDVKSVFRVTIL